MIETIYLDHNILDALIKKRLLYLDDYITEEDACFVYSNETLKEIRKSKGRESQFLDFLCEIGAYYLDVEVDFEGHVTGNWCFRDTDPHEELDRLNEALLGFDDSFGGLDKFQQKFYGGLPNQSFSQIAEIGSKEIEEMLDRTLVECRNELSDEAYKLLAEQCELLKFKMHEASAELGRTLDSAESSCDTRAWEQAVGVGPKELKNITGPDIVLKVFEMVKKSSKSIPESVTLNKLIGLESLFEGAYVPTHNIEKCNSVYHGLNFFGYFRDKDMKKERRNHASLADMTHVGYAAVCSTLLSDDMDLCKKAEAVYEYLNINTKVIYANLNGK